MSRDVSPPIRGQRPVSRDQSRPIRGQYPSHVMSIHQLEASITVDQWERSIRYPWRTGHHQSSCLSSLDFSSPRWLSPPSFPDPKWFLKTFQVLEIETCTKVGHFNVQHQSCKQSNEVLTTLSSGRYLNFSLPGMLGMFFGGVLARGEFLMLIRKFLSYLKSWPVNHRPIRGHYRLHIHSILVPPGNQKPGSRSTWTFSTNQLSIFGIITYTILVPPGVVPNMVPPGVVE